MAAVGGSQADVAVRQDGGTRQTGVVGRGTRREEEVGGAGRTVGVGVAALAVGDGFIAAELHTRRAYRTVKGVEVVAIDA